MTEFYFDIYDKDNNFKFRKNDVLSARIDFDSLSQILCTAEITILEDDRINYISDKIQISCDIDGKNTPLGLYIINSPDRKLTQKCVTRTLRCFSTLKELKDEKTERTLVFKEGTAICETIKRLVGNKKAMTIQDFPGRLSVQKVYPPGAELLEIINDLLSLTTYSRLLVDRLGRFYVEKYVLPVDKDISITYKEKEAQIVDEITETIDYDIPNTFVMTTQDISTNPPIVVVYYNQNASSPVSIQNRGRKVVEFNTVDDITDREVLALKNKKLAYERSQTMSHVTLETGINPAHWYLDCIYLKSYDLNNKYTETSWRMELKNGGKMSHTLRRAVQL